MIQYLREAAITFCKRSRTWRGDEVYRLESAERDLPLVTCNDSVIFEIESVAWRGNSDADWQPPVEAAEFSSRNDWWRDGNPRYYTQRTPGTLRVAPFSAGEIRVMMYLMPDQRADTLPDYLIELYPQIIAAGALAKILMLPRFDFSDPNLAMLQQSQFDAAGDAHFRDNLRGQQRARVRVKSSYL
jgi:hypothetical protein